MKMNKKGFTMVELLAAITILGILMLMGGAAVTIYLDKAKENGYETLARSARQGAEQYIMEFPAMAMSQTEYKDFEKNPDLTSNKIMTFEELEEEQMISSPKDPADTSLKCSGRVIAILNEASDENERALDSYSFVVHECCISSKKKYTFSERYLIKGTTTECNPDEEDNCELVEEYSEELAGVLCD